MIKIAGRIVFMLSFYWLGIAFALSANAENVASFERQIDPAIHCAAAIEVMGRSAPQWSQQPDIMEAKNYWKSRIDQLSEEDQGNAETQLNDEITSLLEAFSKEPSDFARTAIHCSNIYNTNNAVSG